MDELPALSRSAGLPPAWGKCTEPVSFAMPDRLYLAMSKRRIELGMNEAEYMRFCVMKDAMPNEAQSIVEARLKLMFGITDESVTKEGA